MTTHDDTIEPDNRIAINLIIPKNKMGEFFECLSDHGYRKETLDINSTFGAVNFLVKVQFTDLLHAAFVLAAMSKDKERAAQFKLFWGTPE
jgi:hypothetical protein